MSAPVRLRRTLKVQPKIGPTVTTRVSRPIEQTDELSNKEIETNKEIQEEPKTKEINDVEQSLKEVTSELKKNEDPIKKVSIDETQIKTLIEPIVNKVINNNVQELKPTSPSCKDLEKEDDRQSVVSNETTFTSSTSTSDSQFSILTRDTNYKLKYSLEHIQHVIKQKALQKLKESEKQEQREKRRNYRPITLDTENIDRSKMRMRDLLYYIPKNNRMRNTLSDLSIEADENTSNTEIMIEKIQSPEQETSLQSDQSVNAPQLKFAEDGSIVLNEESLIVNRTEEVPVYDRTIVENEANDNLSYRSYRKIHHTKKWSKHETIKFYKALRMIGTDFTMIQKLFPQRTRDEIKRKFKREERINQTLMDRVLSTTDKIDLAVFFLSDDESDSEIVSKKRTTFKKAEKIKKPYDRYDPKRKRKRDFIESDEDENKNNTENSNLDKPYENFVQNQSNEKQLTNSSIIIQSQNNPNEITQLPNNNPDLNTNQIQAEDPQINETNVEELELIYDLDNDTIEITEHNNKCYYNL